MILNSDLFLPLSAYGECENWRRERGRNKKDREKKKQEKRRITESGGEKEVMKQRKTEREKREKNACVEREERGSSRSVLTRSEV